MSLIRTGAISGKAFGGVQLVLCGDFFQLPPVDKKQGSGSGDAPLAQLPYPSAGYAFQAPAWQHANLFLCQLTKAR